MNVCVSGQAVDNTARGGYRFVDLRSKKTKRTNCIQNSTIKRRRWLRKPSLGGSPVVYMPT